MVNSVVNSQRIGLLAEKLGMTRVFSEDGSHIPVTLLKASGNTVTNIVAQGSYNAVQVGFGDIKEKKVSKPLKGHFAKLKVEPKRHLREFRLGGEAANLNVGDDICVTHFVKGQKIDVSSVSKGKGFSGAMKRHNFSGLEASHGVSISHRSHGSTGQCQDPGKVFKGKKMAGQYGNKRITTQSLEVVLVDVDRGFIGVRGAVPGAKGALVELRDAIKGVKAEGLVAPAKVVAKGAAAKVEVSAASEETVTQ